MEGSWLSNQEFLCVFFFNVLNLILFFMIYFWL